MWEKGVGVGGDVIVSQVATAAHKKDTLVTKCKKILLLALWKMNPTLPQCDTLPRQARPGLPGLLSMNPPRQTHVYEAQLFVHVAHWEQSFSPDPHSLKSTKSKIFWLNKSVFMVTSVCYCIFLICNFLEIRKEIWKSLYTTLWFV